MTMRLRPAGVAAALLVMTACTSGGAVATTEPATTGAPTSAAPAFIAGIYECLLPGTPGEPDIAELAEDGTLTITLADGGADLQGTWSLEGDQGMFVTPDFDEPFTVVDGRLVFADTTECTKTG